VFIGGALVRSACRIEVNRFHKEARRPSAADSEGDGQTQNCADREAYVTTTAPQAELILERRSAKLEDERHVEERREASLSRLKRSERKKRKASHDQLS
jgi:hypothetical protein